MPSTVTFPGVFIEEVSSGVHPIEGIPTATTAFVGWARKGPRNKPTKIVSFDHYERIFGGLWRFSTMSYAVRHLPQRRLGSDARSGVWKAPAGLEASASGVTGGDRRD
ncbi:MAG TPA: hypothetical protein VJU77_05745 [Chthoniobacterales bacterium]|nr:hypothetical protein [Chthoniobacterales bacterium]